MKIMLLASCVVMLTACGKTTRIEKPLIPQKYSVDINEDGIDDFEFFYKENSVQEISTSKQQITGILQPLNNTQLLYRSGSGYLFLYSGDTIYSNDNSDAIWFSYPASLIGIHGYEKKWDKEWNIISKDNENYFLGVKINNNDLAQIGWLQLGLNTETGKIDIVNKKFSPANHLKVGAKLNQVNAQAKKSFDYQVSMR